MDARFSEMGPFLVPPLHPKHAVMQVVDGRVERYADRHRVTGIRRNEFLQKLAKFVCRPKG
jgi:hypothetical protein